MQRKSHRSHTFDQNQVDLDQIRTYKPEQIRRKFEELEQTLKDYLNSERPRVPDWGDIRKLKSYRSYLFTQDQTKWLKTDLNSLVTLLSSHKNDDVRFHVAEILGRYLTTQTTKVQNRYIRTLNRLAVPTRFNTQLFEVCYQAGWHRLLHPSRRLPEILWWGVNIRNQKINSHALVLFLHHCPKWKVDLIEYAGKYLTEEHWNDRQLTTLSMDIVNKYDKKRALRHSNWKIRAVAADLVKRGLIHASLQSLYQWVKTDREPEVRVRFRQALVALIIQKGKKEIHAWIDIFLKDMKSAKESELRFIPRALVNLYQFASHNFRLKIIMNLERESKINRALFNRRIAFKTVALIKYEYHLPQDLNTIISALRDKSPAMQDEALVILKKRIRIERLTNYQIKAILMNLNLHGKDWYAIGLVHEVIQLITQLRLAGTKHAEC